MTGYRKILVPYDFSSHARLAFATALDLARRLGADLHLIHVVHIPSYAYHGGVYGEAPPPIDTTAMRDAAARSLAEVAERIPEDSCKTELHVVEGVGVAEALQKAAGDLEADLIVMGTHGRTGLAHVFLGSVAERTLRGAPCPVLTVRAPDEKEE